MERDEFETLTVVCSFNIHRTVLHTSTHNTYTYININNDFKSWLNSTKTRMQLNEKQISIILFLKL